MRIELIGWFPTGAAYESEIFLMKIHKKEKLLITHRLQNTFYVYENFVKSSFVVLKFLSNKFDSYYLKKKKMWINKIFDTGCSQTLKCKT